MENVRPVLRQGEVEHRIGEGQPEYEVLTVAILASDQRVPVASEWTLSAEELAKLIDGGRLRLTVLTFGRPVQPVGLEVIDGRP